MSFETKYVYDNYLDHVLINKAKEVADRIASHKAGEYGDDYNSIWIHEFTKAICLYRSWCKTGTKKKV